MAKKRKSEKAGLDEVERTLYSSFCAAANSISQLYTQSQNQQRLAFQAGERHALERLQAAFLRELNGRSHFPAEQLFDIIQKEQALMDEAHHAHVASQLLPSFSVASQPPDLATAAQYSHQNGQHPHHHHHHHEPPPSTEPAKPSMFAGLSSPARRPLPAFPLGQQVGFGHGPLPPLPSGLERQPGGQPGEGYHHHHHQQQQQRASAPSSSTAFAPPGAMLQSAALPPEYSGAGDQYRIQEPLHANYGAPPAQEGGQREQDNDSSMDTWTR